MKNVTVENIHMMINYLILLKLIDFTTFLCALAELIQHMGDTRVATLNNHYTQI